jgi:hypothetical protein
LAGAMAAQAIVEGAIIEIRFKIHEFTNFSPLSAKIRPKSLDKIDRRVYINDRDSFQEVKVH